VQRCERNGWVTKKRSPDDARCIRVSLTAAARAKVERIAALHRDELDHLGEVLATARASKVSSLPTKKKSPRHA